MRFEAEYAGSNLCIDGGYDICAEMYNKNILAPLATFIPKVCRLEYDSSIDFSSDY